jgi:DNA-binding CsgD family transcriptional regulator
VRFEPRPIPPETQRRMCELYASGMTVRLVAREVGFGAKRTANVLRASGAITKPPDWSPADIIQLRRMLSGGLSYREVAEALGRTEGAVRDAKKRAGIGTIRKAGRPSADLTERGEQAERHLRQEDRRRLMEANIWHLVDLKRAGHSPRHTEMRNPPDTGRPVTFLPTPRLSLYGSPSASCSEG